MRKNIAKLYIAGAYTEAIERAGRELNRRDITFADRFDLYMLKSDAYYNLELYNESIAALKNALRYKSHVQSLSAATAYVNLGVTYLKFKKDYTAYKNFIKCLAICPWHPVANRLIGEIFLSRGDDYYAVYYLVAAARHRYCRSRTLALIEECLQNNNHPKLAEGIACLQKDTGRLAKLKRRRMNCIDQKES